MLHFKKSYSKKGCNCRSDDSEDLSDEIIDDHFEVDKKEKTVFSQRKKGNQRLNSRKKYFAFSF